MGLNTTSITSQPQPPNLHQENPEVRIVRDHLAAVSGKLRLGGRRSLSGTRAAECRRLAVAIDDVLSPAICRLLAIVLSSEVRR